MAQNRETPATGMARASGNVCLAADNSEIAPHRSEIQKNRLQSRFGMPSATAAAVASLAYSLPEKWERRV